MLNTIKLPDLGEGLQGARVVGIHVKVGDEVSEDQIIFDIETDKSVIELPSFWTGVIVSINVELGESVCVGSRLATMLVTGVGDPPEYGSLRLALLNLRSLDIENLCATSGTEQYDFTKLLPRLTKIQKLASAIHPRWLSSLGAHVTDRLELTLFKIWRPIVLMRRFPSIGDRNEYDTIVNTVENTFERLDEQLQTILKDIGADSSDMTSMDD